MPLAWTSSLISGVILLFTNPVVHAGENLATGFTHGYTLFVSQDHHTQESSCFPEMDHLRITGFGIWKLIEMSFTDGKVKPRGSK